MLNFVCLFFPKYFFSLCSHLFQLSDSIKQMRHHQTLHTLLHHPLQPFPGCREGSWEGGMIDGRGGRRWQTRGWGADLVGF